MASAFEIRTASNDEVYFSLIAANGETVGRSETYTTKDSARTGIQSVRANAPDDGRYDVVEGQDGKHYLALKAANGEIILQGQGYSTESNARAGIEAVQRAAAEARVKDIAA